jgi:hypothetical protein
MSVNSSRYAPKLIAERLDIQPMNVYDEAVWASIAREGTRWRLRDTPSKRIGSLRRHGVSATCT